MPSLRLARPLLAPTTLAVLCGGPLRALESPPRILQIYRERLKPGAGAAYRSIEEDRVRICVRLKCPHPYLALESTTEPKEVWWLNAYTSDADRDRVRKEWEQNVVAVAALQQSAPAKKELTDEGTNVFATFRNDLSDQSCWRIGGARFFAIAVTGADGKPGGCVFAAPDGTRFVFTPASTRGEAGLRAAAADAGARIFAVRPTWSLPDEAWIAADPRFWKTNPMASDHGREPVAGPDAVAWPDPSKHDVKFVTVEEGVRLEVLDWGGSGRPVVLLAGSGNSA